MFVVFYLCFQEPPVLNSWAKFQVAKQAKASFLGLVLNSCVPWDIPIS